VNWAVGVAAILVILVSTIAVVAVRWRRNVRRGMVALTQLITAPARLKHIAPTAAAEHAVLLAARHGRMREVVAGPNGGPTGRDSVAREAIAPLADAVS
jgi:hypothetical protein